jgi:hypothetical protein
MSSKQVFVTGEDLKKMFIPDLDSNDSDDHRKTIETSNEVKREMLS